MLEPPGEAREPDHKEFLGGQARRLAKSRNPLISTDCYGVSFAKFLPALIACSGWRMHAVIQTRRPGWLVSLDLSPEDLLNSHLPSPELFDSRVEESFAQRWGPQREGWSLEREAEILCEGQKVFVPDFLLRHADGRKVLLEIVGFWTPEYLAAKFQTLRTFKRHSILLALGKSASARKADLPPGAIHYKTVLRPQDVLQHLRARK